MDVHWTKRFIDFGEDPFLPYDRSPIRRVESESRDELRRLVAVHVPKSPGVYGMLDAIGRLVYVGKSKLLRSRLLSYFMPNNIDEKAGKIIECAQSIVWETQPSEFASLAREQTLIRRFQPRFNVVGMPNRTQPGFLNVGNGVGEQFYITRQWDSQALACQGPIFGMANLHRGVEILNRMFLLRDCSQKTPMRMSDQMQLFDIEVRAGCVRFEIGTCLAPCLDSCSRSAYRQQVERAVDYLNGHPNNLEDRIEMLMRTAASRTHFEHACRLRDDLRILRWLAKRLQQFKTARQSAPFIYSVKGVDGRNVWYLMRNGGIELAIAAPSTSEQWKKTQRLVERWRTEANVVGRGYLNFEETLGLVTAWFYRFKDQQLWTKMVHEMPTRWREVTAWMNQPPVEEPAKVIEIESRRSEAVASSAIRSQQTIA